MTDQATAVREVETKARKTIQTINPATLEPGRAYKEHSSEAAGSATTAARKAFELWRRTSFSERSTVIRKAAEILRRRKDEFAVLMPGAIGS